MSYRRTVPLPAIAFGAVLVLLVVGVVLVVVRGVRRSRRGEDRIAQHGWTRIPDGADVTAGWIGWPFDRATEPGEARDVVTGQYQGAHFLHLRWHQHEGSTRGGGSSDNEDYNIVALRVEQSYPHLSVVRGQHRIDRARLTSQTAELETGDARFDRRWQTLGDAELGRAVLTPEVRAAMEEQGHGWAFQPGSITRVAPWTYYAGEEAMTEELDRLAALLRLVPAEVWRRHGGAPRFLQSLGHGQPHD